MLVSIVTPSYNQGRFIAETIESVLSQEGDFRLEYIIMDACSTDNTVEVIRKYEALLKEGRWPVRCRGIEYRWVSEKDRGQTDAINKGFRRAGGEIVAWLNSDDTYLPGAIDRAVRYFAGHPDVMMIYGEGYEIDEKGGGIRRFKATREFDIKSLINECDYILQPTVFMRKKALDAVGPADERLNWCMDWDLWIRMGKRFRVSYVPEFLANSRIYGDTKTVTGGVERFREIRRVMRNHGSSMLAPGYFSYGFDCLLSLLRENTPALYRFLKRLGSVRSKDA